MNKLFLFLFTAIFFISCGNNNGVSKTDHDHAHDAKTGEKEETVHSDNLTLNNGNKWHADEPTMKNVERLRNNMNDFREGPGTALADYNTLGSQLQSSLDTLVRECKMKGADHDALHVWLMPFMASVKSLKETNDESTAKNETRSISSRLNEFSNYFE